MFMRARLGLLAGCLGIGLGLLALASCNKPQPTSRATVMASTTRPVLHAIYAQDLRQAMRDLNRDASQQVWMQLYTGGGPIVDMAEVARVADRMAQVAVNRLPQAVAGVQMDPGERQAFLGLAQRLRDEAVILKQEAERNELTAAQSTMNQIINTCNSCHTMFRSLAGPL